MNTTLTIKRDIKVDIEKLAEVYTEYMEEMLYDRLAEDLDLSSDDADYICNDDNLPETILNLVKVEMFNRATGMKTRA